MVESAIDCRSEKAIFLWLDSGQDLLARRVTLCYALLRSSNMSARKQSCHRANRSCQEPGNCASGIHADKWERIVRRADSSEIECDLTSVCASVPFVLEQRKNH